MLLSVRTWDSFERASVRLAPLFAGEPSNPFLTWDWMKTYWEATRRPGEEPCLMGVFRGEELVAATAFRIRKTAGVCSVRFLTEGRSDQQGIVGEQSLAVANAILRRVRGLGVEGAAQLNELAEGSPLHEACRLLAGERALVREYPCPYRELGDNAPADSGSNKSFQKRIPNYRKRLEAFGAVELKVIDFDQDRAAALAWIPAMFALHDLRHAGRRNAWKDAANREFLLRYARTAERSNLLAFATLVDGVLVAFDLGFRAGNKFVLYIPAFHPSFEKFRLGHVNRYMTFQECRKLGIDHYDFSRGDSFAKRVWAHGAVDNYSCTLPFNGAALSRLTGLLLETPVRAKAWMRDHNYTARATSVVTFLKGPQAKPSGRKASGALTREAGPLRYANLAGLPMDQLTQLVEFVFAQQQPKNSEWQVTWKSQSLLCASLSPAGPSIEIAC